jgi:outer membrane protein assembly factor BamA
MRINALVLLALSFPLLAQETGWSPQGLPLLSYSTDEGLGYGVRLLLVDHGSGNEQPYRYAITAQFFQTTKRIAAHQLSVDAPHFLGTPVRVEVDLGWSINKFFPYYGLGNTSTYQAQLDTCDDRAALAADPDHCPGDPAFKGLRYYRYDQETLPRIKLNFRRDLNGPWKLFAGYRFRLTRISPLYGADDLGQHGNSRMIEDARAGKLAGYDGSDPGASFRRRTAELTGGLVYDARDNEPAPTEGMFHEVSLRGGLRPLGGEFNYWGANATLRVYHWLVPGYRNLVAAARVLFDVAGGEVPFHLLTATGGLAGPDAVGGDSSVRALLANRLQGKVKALANAELRWRFFSVPHFDFGVVAALDAGRVWAEMGKRDPGPIRAGAAAGLRIAWNRNFVIRFDYGIGISEPYADGNIYLTFDEMF